jgi:hypothetical protein
MYKHQAQKRALNDNDFLAAVSRRFLYSHHAAWTDHDMGELQRATSLSASTAHRSSSCGIRRGAAGW